MREISAAQIEETICRLCVEANRRLPEDVCAAVRAAGTREEQPLAKHIMKDLADNLAAAEELRLPVCQDTGMAVVFARLGQEVYITGGLLARSTAAWRVAIPRGICAARWCPILFAG